MPWSYPLKPAFPVSLKLLASFNHQQVTLCCHGFGLSVLFRAYFNSLLVTICLHLWRDTIHLNSAVHEVQPNIVFASKVLATNMTSHSWHLLQGDSFDVLIQDILIQGTQAIAPYSAKRALLTALLIFVKFLEIAKLRAVSFSDTVKEELMKSLFNIHTC